MAFLLSAGNVDNCTEAVPLLKLLSDLKDCDILADKAYGTKEIRTYLHDQSARYTIPPKVNTKQPWPFDKETYKRRNVIAHFFNRLKEFRRAETRYDKRDDSFLSLLWSPRSASLSAFCTAKRCFQIHPSTLLHPERSFLLISPSTSGANRLRKYTMRDGSKGSFSSS